MARQDSHDALKVLDAVAACARNEDAPPVDTSHEVLRRLRSVQRPTDRGLALLTAGALAAAVVVGIMSIPYFTSALDPLATLMETAAASPI